MYSSHSKKLFRHILINDAENTVNIYVWIYNAKYMKRVAVDQVKNNCLSNWTIGPQALLACFTLGCQTTNLPTNAPAAPPWEHEKTCNTHSGLFILVSSHLPAISKYSHRFNNCRLHIGGQKLHGSFYFLWRFKKNKTLLGARGLVYGITYFLFVQIFMSVF